MPIPNYDKKICSQVRYTYIIPTAGYTAKSSKNRNYLVLYIRLSLIYYLLDGECQSSTYIIIYSNTKWLLMYIVQVISLSAGT